MEPILLSDVFYFYDFHCLVSIHPRMPALAHPALLHQIGKDSLIFPEGEEADYENDEGDEKGKAQAS